MTENLNDRARRISLSIGVVQPDWVYEVALRQLEAARAEALEEAAKLADGWTGTWFIPPHKSLGDAIRDLAKESK